MKRALVIGGDSTIGLALKKELKSADWKVYTTSRRKPLSPLATFYLDLLNPSDFVFEPPIDVVFLCANITKIADCKQQTSLSLMVNKTAQIILAEYFLKRSIHVVFLSSVAVFDGHKPYFQTDDPRSPLTLYGQYKLEVEQALERHAPNVTIVRLSKVLTANHPLILGWIKNLQSNLPIEPFYDLSLCPVSINDVSWCLKKIAERKIPGIVHLSGEKEITYEELAIHLNKLLQTDEVLIRAISCKNTELASIPLYNSLDTTDTKKELKFEFSSLKTMLKDLYGNMVKINKPREL